LEARDFAGRVGELILSKKGFDVKILELKEISSVADYFVICSADSNIQVKAIADEVDDKLRDIGIKCHFKEGYSTLNWVILDYFDVVVHVFKKDAREFYNLEKLWGDAPTEIITDELGE
jgi:ribosome-associated protein